MSTTAPLDDFNLWHSQAQPPPFDPVAGALAVTGTALADALREVAKQLGRQADAQFRQAKASERAVALQEKLVESSRRMAENTITAEQLRAAIQDAQ